MKHRVSPVSFGFTALSPWGSGLVPSAGTGLLILVSLMLSAGICKNNLWPHCPSFAGVCPCQGLPLLVLIPASIHPEGPWSSLSLHHPYPQPLLAPTPSLSHFCGTLGARGCLRPSLPSQATLAHVLDM